MKLIDISNKRDWYTHKNILWKWNDKTLSLTDQSQQTENKILEKYFIINVSNQNLV